MTQATQTKSELDLYYRAQLHEYRGELHRQLRTPRFFPANADSTTLLRTMAYNAAYERLLFDIDQADSPADFYQAMTSHLWELEAGGDSPRAIAILREIYHQERTRWDAFDTLSSWAPERN